MFKGNCTQNIHTSWKQVAGLRILSNKKDDSYFELKELEEFTQEELNHLKWLIEERLNSWKT